MIASAWKNLPTISAVDFIMREKRKLGAVFVRLQGSAKHYSGMAFSSQLFSLFLLSIINM